MKRPLRHPLESRVAQVVRSAGFARPAGPLLVAVSGGPDSTALLHALVSLRADFDLKLHVVHVDHGIRLESRQDATYTSRLARRWNLPCTVRAVDVRGLQSAHGLSLEDAARQARYSALSQIASEVGAVAVFTGHSADDQTETVLLALLRGAGLRGMSGMQLVDRFPPTLDDPAPPAIPLIRPLLTSTRADIEAYLKICRLRPRRDPTNAAPEFLRNRVRSELVPLLEDLRPGSSETVRRVAHAAQEAFEFLETKAREAWPSVARKENDALFLHLAGFSRLPAALRPLILQRAAQETGNNSFTAQHMKATTRLLDNPIPGRTLHLPRGLRLTIMYGEAALTKGDPQCPLPSVATADLALPGRTVAGGWIFHAALMPDGGCVLEASSGVATKPPLPGPWAIHVNAPCPALIVRRRQPGDRLRLSHGSRKVQDVLTDARTPRSWRDNVPVVVNVGSGEILWVVGVRFAVSAHPASPTTSETSRI